MAVQRLYERTKKPSDYSVSKALKAAGRYPRLEPWKAEFYHCSRCGSCRDMVLTDKIGEMNYYDPKLVPWLGPLARYEACPNYVQTRWDHFAPRGRNQILRALNEGWIELTPALAENAYFCVDCRICEMVCKSGKVFGASIPITSIMRAWREEIIETNPALLPAEVTDFLENTRIHGNPWGKSKAERGKWAEGTAIPKYKTGSEYLYYVGDEGSYDTRCQDSARALGECLLSAGVSFGILGSNEVSDGGNVYRLGEAGLFESLVDENLKRFRQMGVKKIVALSAHSFDGLKSYYPKDKGFEVIHEVQLLAELVKKSKLKPTKKLKARVTYHDACFLGRYHDIYEEPREILKSIPGVELVEMKRNRKISYCCGGGAGNYQTGIVDKLIGAENRPDRFRVREARDSGANILAVACPGCLMRLSDAVKVEGLEGKLEVKEISEILRASL